MISLTVTSNSVHPFFSLVQRILSLTTVVWTPWIANTAPMHPQACRPNNIQVLCRVMAAHSNGQASIFCSCGFYLSFFFFLFFPRLISVVGDWISAILHTWCGLSANFECMSEMCCTQLAENTGCKNYAKNRHLCTIAQLCWAIYIFATKACIDNWKKLLMAISPPSSQHGELRPTNSWDLLASLGHPSKFQRVSHLGFVIAPTLLNGGQPNFALCLAISCTGILYIHFWELLPSNRILPSAKFTLHPSLALSYIGSVTARHSTPWVKKRVPP